MSTSESKAETHSPEHWKFECWLDGPVHVIDSDGKSICGYIGDFSGFTTNISPAIPDMQRIVACVNACRGFDSQDLLELSFQGSDGFNRLIAFWRSEHDPTDM